MKAAFLPDRGVVKVSGEDARNFLNGLVTTDIEAGSARAGPFRRAADAAGQDHRRFPDHRGARRPWRRLPARLPARAGARARRQARLLQAARQGRGRESLRQPRRARGLGRQARHDGRIWPSPIRAMRELGWRILVPEELAQKVADLIGAELVDAQPMRRIASRAACRAAASISSMAMRSRTRPTWTGCTASISTRAAMSARRWCRACSIAAPRGPAPCASCSKDPRRNRARPFSPATRRSAPWARRRARPVSR